MDKTFCRRAALTKLIDIIDIRLACDVMLGGNNLKLNMVIYLDDDMFLTMRDFVPSNDPVEFSPPTFPLVVVGNFGSNSTF